MGRDEENVPEENVAKYETLLARQDNVWGENI